MGGTSANGKASGGVIDAAATGRYFEATGFKLGKGAQEMLSQPMAAGAAVTQQPVIRKVTGSFAVRRIVPR